MKSKCSVHFVVSIIFSRPALNPKLTLESNSSWNVANVYITGSSIYYTQKAFFFYHLGPVCLSSGSTAAIEAYCALPLMFKLSPPVVSPRDPGIQNLDWGPVPHFCPLEALQPVWLMPETYFTIYNLLMEFLL
jgi:hypothetical protein